MVKRLIGVDAISHLYELAYEIGIGHELAGFRREKERGLLICEEIKESITLLREDNVLTNDEVKDLLHFLEGARTGAEKDDWTMYDANLLEIHVYVWRKAGSEFRMIKRILPKKAPPVKTI